MRSVHLVGSIPLSSTDEVFSVVPECLGDRVHRIPDGETGSRSGWVLFQSEVMGAQAGLVRVEASIPTFRLREGVDPAALNFGELGYARAARESYRRFSALRTAGIISEDVRFQVSLPTPFAPVNILFDADSQVAVEAPYRAALLRELDEILDSIPHADLAVQWDVAAEFALLEGVSSYPVVLSSRDVAARLRQLVERVPERVELGLHLCYGDLGHQHFVQPRDTALMVEVATAVLLQVGRTVEWLHMPVPVDRDDPAYFKPLSLLPRDKVAELFLGLIHMSDGVEGAMRRALAAKAFVGEFGVATECGFGRRDPRDVRALLELHRDVIRALDAQGPAKSSGDAEQGEWQVRIAGVVSVGGGYVGDADQA